MSDGDRVNAAAQWMWDARQRRLAERGHDFGHHRQPNPDVIYLPGQRAVFSVDRLGETVIELL